MGPTGCPETSVLNQPSLHNNTEDGRVYVNAILPEFTYWYVDFLLILQAITHAYVM
jgi:hypothetical protein